MCSLKNRFDMLENESIEIIETAKKTCRVCEKEKDLNDFYEGRRKCKECYRNNAYVKKGLQEYDEML